MRAIPTRCDPRGRPMTSVRRATISASVWMVIVGVFPTEQGAAASVPAGLSANGKVAGTFTVPGQLAQSGGPALRYENGFLLVPENRKNPASRLIAVRYIRFPAKRGRTDQPPVVMLPGGPGDSIEEAWITSNQWLLRTIERVSRSADFIIMQQRGAPTGAYTSRIMASIAALPVSAPRTAAAERARLESAIADALPRYESMGFDLRGYDVLQLVEDIEALRTTLGYDKIVLQGQSFGSQWGMAYLKLHGARVARALFTGFEPLDYAWDSPGALWETYQRIAGRAEAHPALQNAVPAGGLIAAYQKVVRRLERKPQPVKITHPDDGKDVVVTIGADDLRYLRAPVSGSRRENIEAWPKFVIELYNGDYRPLAASALADRRATEENLLWLLVDSSLDISPTRERVLNGEKKGLTWLGDPNAEYRTVRGKLPTADVGNDFRADADITVPTLVVHGDLDLSTPLPNALSQIPRLKNGRVVVVEGGTHSVRAEVLSDGLVPDDRGFAEQYLAFLAGDTPGGPAAVLESLPERVRLTEFSFKEPGPPSLYDEWIEAAAKR